MEKVEPKFKTTKKFIGFVSNLSISVPQETTWATSNPTFLPANSNIVYPHYVDVSFEMTIIENHVVDNDTITYRFDEVKPNEPNTPAVANEPKPEGPGDSTYSLKSGFVG